MLGAEHSSTLNWPNSNYAGILRRQGILAEATRIHRETLEVERRVLGAEHPSTPASASNLADALEEQGELEQAGRIE